MSLTGKKLHLCSCNGTMPLSAERIAAALDLPEIPPVRTMLCQKELGSFAAASDGDVVVACTQEARLFGDVAEEGGRTQTIRFVNIRETGGWSAEAPAATPKIAALLALAGLPEPDPVPSVSYRSEGQHADRRPDGRRAALGQGAVRTACGDGARDRPQHRRRIAVRAHVPGLLRHADATRRLAGRVRRRLDDRQSDRPRSLHALQRLRQGLPRARDRLELPDRPRSLQEPSRVRGRLRRDGGDRLRAQRPGAQRAVRPRARPAAHPGDPAAPAAAGLPRPGRRRGGAGAGGGGADRDGRRVREAQVLQLQGVDLRPQPVAEGGLQPLPRRLLHRGDLAPTATTSRSSRTCAWVAAPARPSARPER